jgi:hypothetical protein
MLRSTVSILLILSCCLVAIEAAISVTPPRIECIDDFQGLRGFQGLAAAKRECYKSLASMKDRIEGKDYHRITPWDILVHGGPAGIVPLRPTAEFRFQDSLNCGIHVDVLRNEHPDRTTQPDFRTWYLYYWEHVQIVVKQILEQCFSNAHGHGISKVDSGNVRLIGDGTLSIGLDSNIAVQSQVSVFYFGEI